jgi:hypothetical protein
MSSTKFILKQQSALRKAPQHLIQRTPKINSAARCQQNADVLDAKQRTGGAADFSRRRCVQVWPESVILETTSYNQLGKRTVPRTSSQMVVRQVPRIAQGFLSAVSDQLGGPHPAAQSRHACRSQSDLQESGAATVLLAHVRRVSGVLLPERPFVQVSRLHLLTSSRPSIDFGVSTPHLPQPTFLPSQRHPVESRSSLPPTPMCKTNKRQELSWHSPSRL